MQPFVSVLMPVRNEAASIERSLGAVLAQDYPSDRFEVVIADGMSTDDTRRVIATLAGAARESGGPDVHVIDNPGQIVPTALNAALRTAKGEVIVRVDGHCVIERDYVSRCVEVLERTGADNVGGAQRAVGEGVLGEAIALAGTSPLGTGGAAFRHADREGWVETVYLGAWRREVFDRVGMFDEDFVRTQDAEFNFRLIQSGGRIWLDRSIHVTYHGRNSLRTLWRQYFQYGVYKVLMMRKRGGASARRQLVPPAFVLALGAGTIVSVVLRSPWPVLAVAIPYLAALCAAAILGGRRRPATIPVLPVVFAVMHLSYGLGILRGIGRFGAPRPRRGPAN